MMKKRMNKSGNSLHILIGRLLIQISRDLCQHCTNTVRMILMSNRHKQTIGWCINTFITQIAHAFIDMTKNYRAISCSRPLVPAISMKTWRRWWLQCIYYISVCLIRLFAFFSFIISKYFRLSFVWLFNCCCSCYFFYCFKLSPCVSQ